MATSQAVGAGVAKVAKGAPGGRSSLRALARGLGCTHHAVQKAVERGRLAGAVARDGRGRLVVLDADLAARLWAEQRSKPAPGHPGEAIRTPEGVPKRPRPVSTGSLVEVQIRATLARARAQEMAIRVRRGELIERREADSQAFAAARDVRDNILNVPDRVSAELAGETDPARVHARLMAELQGALESLAGVLDHG